jgi:hypothetical protein
VYARNWVIFKLAAQIVSTGLGLAGRGVPHDQVPDVLQGVTSKKAMCMAHRSSSLGQDLTTLKESVRS